MYKLEDSGRSLEPTVNPFHEELGAARPRPFLPRRSFDVFVNMLTRPFPSHRPILELTKLFLMLTSLYAVRRSIIQSSKNMMAFFVYAYA